ncbi:hypothetical protein PLESTM_000526500 [Pleodorina starrii]|nr:hypothetical protein PLESTM_000526500 [Pleodorina starrii]
MLKKSFDSSGCCRPRRPLLVHLHKQVVREYGRRPGLCTVTDGEEMEDELLAQVVLEEQNDARAQRDVVVADDGGGGCLATASVKVDGSLILAFMWGGQLRTATRRRLDSEQVRRGREAPQCWAGGAACF